MVGGQQKTERLTGKQKAFAIAYCANGFNGTQAARDAGYKSSDATLAVIAYENLRKPKIRAAIDEMLKANRMSKDEVLYRLSMHAGGDLRPLMGLSTDELKAHPLAWLVKKHEVKQRRLASNVVEETVRIEIHDPQAALNTLLKYHQIEAGQPTEIIQVMPVLRQLIPEIERRGLKASDVFEAMLKEVADADRRQSGD